MQGTSVQLQGTCTDELADFVLTPGGFLRHQYSGLCAALNPAVPGTEPASPAALASQNAAVESAGVGEASAVLLPAGTSSTDAAATHQAPRAASGARHGPWLAWVAAIQSAHSAAGLGTCRHSLLQPS